jgi:hypothetical protein
MTDQAIVGQFGIPAAQPRQYGDDESAEGHRENAGLDDFFRPAHPPSAQRLHQFCRWQISTEPDVGAIFIGNMLRHVDA